MRWRLLGLFMFALAASAAWTFWIRPDVELWLKDKIESVLSERSGQEVRLDALSLHPLLLRVVVDGVRVGPHPDPLFTCKRWTFHTARTSEAAPLSLLLLTFGRSDLDSPFVRVPAFSGGPIHLPDRWWRELPLHRLTWKNGAILVPLGRDRASLSVSHSEGALQLSPGGFLLNTEGDSPLGKFRFGLKGNESFRRGAHLDVRGEGRLEDAPLAFLSPWLPPRLGRFMGGGNLSVNAVIKDLNIGNLSMKDVVWEGKVGLKDVIWFPSEARPKDLGVPLEGEVAFRGGRVDLTNLRLFHALTVSGSVVTGSEGSVDLAWKGENLLLADVNDSGVSALRSVPSRGTVDTEGTLSGTLARPVAKGTAEVRDAGYPGLIFPAVKVQGQWKDDWLSLGIKGLSGQLDVGGTLRLPSGNSPSSRRDWTLRAAGLDLSHLAKRNGWPRVGGLFTGSFSLLQEAGDVVPKAEGALRIDSLSWGVHQETSTVQGRLTLDQEGLRVRGDRGVFDLEVHRSSSGVWRVDRLAYEAGDLRLWGRGFLRDAEGNVLIEGGLGGVHLSAIPPLAKWFPSVEGTFSTEGRWHGTWGDPIFAGSIHLDGARWRPGGISHRGGAELRGGRRGVTVARFHWDDHVQGEAAWLFGQGGHLSMDVDKARGEDLFDFLAVTGTVSGVFSGKMSLSSGGRPGLEGWGRFSGENGRWGNVSFEETKGMVYFRGPRIELESLEIRQAQGSLQVTGDASRRSLNPVEPGVVWEWGASARAAGFTAGPAVLSATWTVRGISRLREKSGAAVLSGYAVELGRTNEELGREALFSLGNVRAKFSWSPPLFRLDELTSDRGIRAEGNISPNGQALNGRVLIKDLSLSNLIPSLPERNGVRLGQANGQCTLSGSWSEPKGEATVVFSGAGWREVAVGGELHALWNRGVEVPRFSLSFPEGGALVLKGTWRRASSDSGKAWSRLEGRLEQAALGPFLRSVGRGSDGPGFLHGDILLEGPPDEMRGTLSVGGQLRRGDALPVAWQSRFQISGSTATVEEAALTVGKGLTGEGVWRLRSGSTVSRGKSGHWNVQLNNDLRNMGMGPLHLFGGLSLEGSVALGERTVTGRIGAQSLWINQRLFDQPLADVRLSTEEVVFSPLAGAKAFVQGRVRLDRWPQSFFENLTVWDSGRRILVLAGELGPGAWDFSLQGWGLQADTLLTLADFDWPISGPWTVKVRGRGSLSSPNVQAEISGGPGRIGPLPYDRLEAQAHWVGHVVDVRGLQLVRRKGYVLTGEGRFPVRASPGAGIEGTDLNLHLAQGNLAVLKEVWPLCRSAKGSFSGDLRVEPGTKTPRVTGAFRVQDGRMNLYSYAPRVRDLNAELTFQNDRVRVGHARARVGAGWIEMAGDIAIPGVSPVEYDLSIQSDRRRGVSVEVPQLSVPPGPLLGRFSFLSEKLKGISSGEPRVSLRVKGPHGKHVISGEVVLEETHFTYPPTNDSGAGIRGPQWWRNFWRMAAWDVQFKSGQETWYRNEYVNVRLKGGLHLLGHSRDWAVNGRVAASEGAINYLGQIFQVKRGDFELITTSGGETLGTQGGVHAYLSGEAERVVTTVDARGLSTDDTISLVVDRAKLSEIQPRFVSRNSPDLKSDRVALKALGIASEKQGTPADRDLLFRAGLVQLVGSSAAPLANRLAQKLGIGMISPIYEPPEAEEDVPTAAPATSKDSASEPTSPLSDYLRGAGASARIRVTDRLSGVYKVKLDEAKDQTYFRDQVEIILRIKGSLHVRASTELDSAAQLGQPPERRASLENIWRFGLPRKKKKADSEPDK
jgi:hypothetical protein